MSDLVGHPNCWFSHAQSQLKPFDRMRFFTGTTTVLTMTFIGLDNRNDLPKVNYSTALDVYVAMCFVFVLATIIQFASVHYYTKFGCGEGPETIVRKSADIGISTDVEVHTCS